MHISHFGRLDRPAHAVDANAKRPVRWVPVAVMILDAVLYVVVALLSAVALQQLRAGVTWTPLG